MFMLFSLQLGVYLMSNICIMISSGLSNSLTIHQVETKGIRMEQALSSQDKGTGGKRND